ncbi:CPXCG motif-containing cysteine-rich protein [Thiomicrorhabdus xiamenensis]|uniref:CPXCG motif-containing cysteine-rich protein n=1 Tax=Thiomicrorhabdus xiamenensis TaxID=2739063 RepID=A0A7D4NRS0_9GAMM|nr:CPXCG motif-containing cysteine-rich protein [Thiomicrorhabdus xiamenensis]QKI90132.1 CPXCG motif-containing cysteine-rich protein [Thiomicrorhabdus xiamenensis]
MAANTLIPEARVDLQNLTVQCPYCWSEIEIIVDPSDPSEHFIEDCSVCCRPIHFHKIIQDDGAIELIAKHEDESYD